MREFLAENKHVALLLTITLVLGVLPYIPCGWALIIGDLPSLLAWETKGGGGNHGPWWNDEPHQLLIFLPTLSLVILPGPTLVTAIVDSLVNKRNIFSPQGSALFLLLLCPVQWLFAAFNAFTIFWTIN